MMMTRPQKDTPVRLAVALAYQKAAGVCEASRARNEERGKSTDYDVRLDAASCEAEAEELRDAILALADADALAEVQALKAERDHWKRIADARKDANDLVDGLTQNEINARQAAEAEVARLRTIQGAAGVLYKEAMAAAYLGENVTPDEEAMLAFMDVLGKHKVLVARAALGDAG